MDPALRLHPGQERLTPAQEAEARRFAEARITAQLSTEPVDEPETERRLQQAYVAAGLPPPSHTAWLDGPLQLFALQAPEYVKASVGDSVLEDSAWKSLWTSVRDSVRASVGDSVWASVRDRVGYSVRDGVFAGVFASVRASARDSVGSDVWASVQARLWANVWDVLWASVRAYDDAPWLAVYHFFDEYLAPNALHALAHFNERVSGYWLGKEEALLVRRPSILARDQAGRLHSASGKCLVYPDGWGFYAWHGVRVPEQIILAPETLTRKDFLKEQNVEVRRVIQERMGSRFVSELGGVVLDNGPRGTLYEVPLLDDPERVARYVQVQDASTPRQYVLRVPPTVQTAAEAVAWSFGLPVEEYAPAHET